MIGFSLIKQYVIVIKIHHIEIAFSFPSLDELSKLFPNEYFKETILKKNPHRKCSKCCFDYLKSTLVMLENLMINH